MSRQDSDFHAPLRSAMGHALAHLSSLANGPVGATVDLHTLRARLNLPLTEEGVEAGQVVEDLVAAVQGGLVDNASGRFFGWVNGGSLPAAMAADWLTSAWDQNAALYACSPAAAVVEEIAGGWLKEMLNLPASASFALVTGCQMAHVTCLAAGRHALLSAKGWDVEQNGLFGAPPIRILSSTEHHGSTTRAVQILGLGKRQMKELPADAEGRLLPEALERELAKDTSLPAIVVLQAGDLNIGAFDAFETLIPIAKRHGAWVHIDGAFGLWVAASRQSRHLLRGAELADSWATDGHKWLNVPYDCGYAFVADAEAHRAAVSHRAAYLIHDTDARDEMNWNPEWSRRGRGFATYAALRQLGRSGVAALIDRCCGYAHSLVTRIGALPGAEMIWEPQINQGLVRFLSPSDEATEFDHDAYTEAVMAAIQASGKAFFTGTTWRGMRAMRVSVCSWQTSAQDVEKVVQCVADVLADLSLTAPAHTKSR